MSARLDHGPTAGHARIDAADMGRLLVQKVRVAASRLDGAAADRGAELAALTQALEKASEGRIRRRIREVFRLTPQELDLLDAAAALALEPDLCGVLAPLANGRPVAGAQPALIAKLFGHERPLRLGPKSPLVLWSLVEPGGAWPHPDQSFLPDPAILSALLGEAAIDERLAPYAEPQAGQAVTDAGRDGERIADRVAGLLEQGVPVRVLVRSASSRAGLVMARAVATALGARLLTLNLPAELAPAERADLFMRAQRIALLAGYVPCWTAAPVPWPLHVSGSLLQFVLARPGQDAEAVPGLRDFECRPPELSLEDRKRLLAAALPASTWPDSALTALAPQCGCLDDITALATEAPQTPAEAQEALRRRIVERVGAAGVLVETPYRWEDLVLPARVAELLRQIPFEIRARERLAQAVDPAARSLYGRIATSALFCGASGTGKTMAAQVIARDLGADLVRVDLAATISKYIGETAKNLRRLFEQVAGTGAVLMFDEADALFARRTEVKDAHDRHANADTNYLLQLIEGFDGAVLLATNKRDNIDPAFMRRLRHVIEFPQPGPAERRRLWLAHIAHFGGDAADEQLAGLVAELAAAVDLTPAQIRNAAVTAGFAMIARGAQTIAAADLLAGVERELGKDGRALARSERERLGRHE